MKIDEIRKKLCDCEISIIYHIIDNNGSEIDKSILKMLKSTIDEGRCVYTEEEAIQYLCKYINNTYNYTQSDEKKRSYVKGVILKEYLNHLGDNEQKKIYFTGFITEYLTPA